MKRRFSSTNIQNPVGADVFEFAAPMYTMTPITDIVIVQCEAIAYKTNAGSTTGNILGAVASFESSFNQNNPIQGVSGTGQNVRLYQKAPMLLQSVWNGEIFIEKGKNYQVNLITYGNILSADILTVELVITYEEAKSKYDYFVHKKSPAEQAE